jgi:hypothetical protein
MPKQTVTFPRFNKILLAWLVVGTLDMLGALLVYSVILKKTTADKIVRGIASGIFKKDAMTGGNEMLLYGVFFHYFIAFVFTLFFFLIYPYVPFFRKQKILGGLLYGLFIWVIMNLVVLNIVFPTRPLPTFESAAIGASILMVMIGLPLSYFAGRNSNKL